MSLEEDSDLRGLEEEANSAASASVAGLHLRFVASLPSLASLPGVNAIALCMANAVVVMVISTMSVAVVMMTPVAGLFVAIAAVVAVAYLPAGLHHVSQLVCRPRRIWRPW